MPDGLRRSVGLSPSSLPSCLSPSFDPLARSPWPLSKSTEPDLSEAKPGLFATGDINAFFGLMLDNVGDMILMAGLLTMVFGFPREFVLSKMMPGTAIGVMIGDLIYTFMAWRLSRKTGRV